MYLKLTCKFHYHMAAWFLAFVAFYNLESVIEKQNTPMNEYNHFTFKQNLIELIPFYCEDWSLGLCSWRLFLRLNKRCRLRNSFSQQLYWCRNAYRLLLAVATSQVCCAKGRYITGQKKSKGRWLKWICSFHKSM